MRRRNAFQIETLATLEERVVLSRMGATAHVASLVPGARGPGRRVAPVPAGINAAFDSFIQDYTQARGVYLSVLTSSSTDASKDATPPPPPTKGEETSTNSSLRDAFTNYTRNRVDVLAQQLTGLFVHASAGSQSHSSQSQGAGSGFYRVVRTRVNGLEISTTTNTGTTTSTTSKVTAQVFRLGTLGRALLDSTPTAPASAGTISLDTLSQDQAIEASRVAVINGFYFNKSANSGHNKKN